MSKLTLIANKKCMIGYRTNLNLKSFKNAFWYHDIGQFLKDKKYLMIDSIIVDKNCRNQGIGTKTLKEFCEAHPDHIILLQSAALKSEYPTEPSKEEFSSILDKLENFFISRGFMNINKFTNTYEFSELYIYNNKPGNIVYEDIVNFYSE